jgi:transposase
MEGYIMHLSYSTSKYKGKVYKSYSIAESYRDGKKVKKRTIWPIGKLTDEQAEQIRYICKIAKSNAQLVVQLKDIVVKDTRAYLDLSVVNEIWNRWQLDDAFDLDITASELPTPLIAKILTMNRCTSPCSHYAIPAWAAKTALAEVLGVDLGGLNDDKIYYELSKIQKNKISIENHLFKQTYRRNPDSYGFINYDLSTSYFVGYKCNLSAFGKGKIECHGRRQVLLGVLINDQGYPFKWDVFPGNTAEVKTLEQNINACKTRFKLSGRNVTLVFDRGIISEDNGALIDKANMKYISALDRNQIPSCGVALTAFAKLSYEKETDKSPLPKGFKKFDDDLYFLDCGIIGAKRLITGFNPNLFREDRRNRDEKIDFFKTFLQKENKQLKKAKRDRSLEATKNRIVQELTRLKIKKYYEPPTLHPIAVRKTLKNGVVKSVKSFQVKINKKVDVIKNDKLLDGVCVFVTNHTEHHGRGFKVKPQAVIGAYRDKTKIEDVFKNVKSFLKLRPFFVNTDAHVKAVYTVCILAYFINKYLASQRKALGEKDYLNSKELYGPFKDIDIATIEDSQTGQTVKKAASLPANTQRLLEYLNMTHIVFSQEN